MAGALGDTLRTRIRLVEEAEKSYLLLRTDPKEDSVLIMENLRGVPGVRSVDMTAGEYSFVVATTGDVRKQEEKIRRIKGVKEVHTTTVGRVAL